MAEASAVHREKFVTGKSAIKKVLRERSVRAFHGCNDTEPAPVTSRPVRSGLLSQLRDEQFVTPAAPHGAGAVGNCFR